jgi:DNA-binding transcriptional ArsR family regulator
MVPAMTACPTCGADPCANPDFCRACRYADRRKARGESPRYIDPSLWRGPPDHIPPNWETMSIEALMAHFDRARRRHGAPQPTVEALMFSLRERGVKALEERDTKRRLYELSDQQVIEVGNRLQKLKPEIARKWTREEVNTLFQARIGT